MTITMKFITSLRMPEIKPWMILMPALSGFIGKSEEVTEAISAAITCVKEQIKKCEECQKLSINRAENIKDLQSCHCPEHDNKLKDLQNKNEKTANSNENPKTLLTNLTDGLEKFLGFNPDSKGYTGSGIVYSDLDRLCDGVMAFLLQCLEGAKTLLHHYFPDITRAISDLERSIGKGRGVSGFAQAIGIVQRGLEGYESGMEERISNIKEPLTTLINHVETQLEQFKKPDYKEGQTRKTDEELSKIFNVGNVETVLASCIQKTKKYIADILDAENYGLRLLDPEFRSKLREPLMRIRQEVKRFSKSSDKDFLQLEEMKKTIKTTLESLRKSVKKKSMMMVAAIRVQIEGIEIILSNRIKELEKWIEEASAVVTEAETQVGIIEKEVNDPPSGHSNNKSKLQSMAEKIEKQLGTKVKELKDWIENADNVMKEGLAKVPMLHQKVTELKDKYNQFYDNVKGPDGNGGLLEKLKGANVEVKKVVKRTTLKTFKDKDNGGWDLTEQIDGLTDHIETILRCKFGIKLYELLQNATRNGLEYILEDVFHAIKQAKDIWGDAQPAFAELISELQTDLDTKITAGKFESHLVSLLKTTANTAINKLQAAVTKMIIEESNKNLVMSGVGTLLSQAKDAKEAIERQAKLVADKLRLMCTAINDAAGDQAGLQKVLSDLQTLGLAEGDQKWQGKDHSARGLRKVMSEVEEMEIKDAPAVTTSLSLLCTEIANATENIKLKLNNLKKQNISGTKDNELAGIRTNINKLKNNEVKSAIQAAMKFIESEANEEGKKTTKKLEEHVDYEVNAAISTLTDLAEKQYVDSRIHELTIFAAVAKKQYVRIIDIIYQDKITCTKGFLGTFNSKFITRVSEIKDVQKYISFAAKIVNDGFRNFLSDLGQQTDFEPVSSNLFPSADALGNLLKGLHTSEHFDYKFSEHLDALDKALSTFTPTKFTDPSNAILQCLKDGFEKLYEQLNMAYVSKYSGAFKMFNWDADGPKAARACLSFLPTLAQDLITLKSYSNSDWQNKQIYLYERTKNTNSLGVFLANRGFSVSKRDNGYEGELKNKPNCKGSDIFGKLTGKINGGADRLFTSIKGEKEEGLITKLFNYYEMYLRVCHQTLPSPARYPCSVRDMLSWMSGVPYSHVFSKVHGHVKSLLNEDANKKDTVMTTVLKSQTYNPLKDSCKRSAHLLVAICGNGHGAEECDYPYSVCFSNNHGNFYYPSDPATLLGMVYDIVRRLCYVLYFLYAQCKRTASAGNGWKECAYGQNVPSANWSCKDHSNIRPNGQPTDQPKCQPNGQANGQANTKLNCPPTSPLQSFLRDSCAGFLPHVLTAKNNAIQCSSCKHNQPGQQCLTPMGFRDLDFAASIEHTGEYLTYYLGQLCSDADACLFELCRSLSYICPTAPKTLADMFTLYTQLFRKWELDKTRKASSYYDNSAYLTHIKDSTIEKSFPLNKNVHDNFDNSSLTTAITALVGHGHRSHDALSSLFTTDACTGTDLCALS
ncbi:Extracellular matrix-binding ebh, putative [Babesia ovata]|uniref:Extracellular matrix-binding ebh, putative n=1 Tax=Babesia ovata TaxID=189622 RepID=A0A2H6KJW9_9APIC|nr:Extracellular matrix-binding ebh, putative [Babesia ovata]GBE63286.1 Extracellular matrix-binding ebh, putative [Babesia ovata]